MSRKDIKNQILNYNNAAAKQAELAREACRSGQMNKEQFIETVHRYICAKFFLSPDEDDQTLLVRLAEKSIEKAIQMKIPFAKDSEMATTCGAAGTSAVKVALLMLAVQRDFQISISPDKLAFVKTGRELGGMIYCLCRE